LPTLALASMGTNGSRALFIDEGFGTLDPDETLDIVTQALGTCEQAIGLSGL